MDSKTLVGKILQIKIDSPNSSMFSTANYTVAKKNCWLTTYIYRQHLLLFVSIHKNTIPAGYSYIYGCTNKHTFSSKSTRFNPYFGRHNYRITGIIRGRKVSRIVFFAVVRAENVSDLGNLII